MMPQDEFYSIINAIIKPDKKNYDGYFNDSEKPFRGFINLESKQILIERNLGPLRGFNPKFISCFNIKENMIIWDIEIKPKYSDYFLFALISIFLLFIVNGNYLLNAVLPMIGLYVFFNGYFQYDSFIVIKMIEDRFKDFIVLANNKQ